MAAIFVSQNNEMAAIFVFQNNEMAAIFVSQNNEMAAIFVSQNNEYLCPKLILWDSSSILIQTFSIVSVLQIWPPVTWVKTIHRDMVSKRGKLQSG